MDWVAGCQKKSGAGSQNISQCKVRGHALFVVPALAGPPEGRYYKPGRYYVFLRMLSLVKDLLPYRAPLEGVRK